MKQKGSWTVRYMIYKSLYKAGLKDKMVTLTKRNKLYCVFLYLSERKFVAEKYMGLQSQRLASETQLCHLFFSLGINKG